MSESSQVNSKFLRVFLIMIMAIFVFVGPTYLPLILNELLGLSFSLSVIVGFIVFLIGVFDLLFLARKKVIT
jgi:pilus assembly protein TadC